MAIYLKCQTIIFASSLCGGHDTEQLSLPSEVVVGGPGEVLARVSHMSSHVVLVTVLNGVLILQITEIKKSVQPSLKNWDMQLDGPKSLHLLNSPNLLLGDHETTHHRT